MARIADEQYAESWLGPERETLEGGNAWREQWDWIDYLQSINKCHPRTVFREFQRDEEGKEQ
jgi:hypothetical protein